jgi:hypothetical protein
LVEEVGNEDFPPGAHPNCKIIPDDDPNETSVSLQEPSFHQTIPGIFQRPSSNRKYKRRLNTRVDDSPSRFEADSSDGTSLRGAREINYRCWSTRIWPCHAACNKEPASNNQALKLYSSEVDYSASTSRDLKSI